MGTSRLGSLLVEEGLLSESDRRTIKGTCGSHGPAFARSIIALGLLEEDELAAFLAEKTPWRVASKDLMADSDQRAWGVVDRPLLERLEVLPLKLAGQTLYVAMVDPLDQDTIKQLAFFSGYKIHPVISTLSHIRSSLKKLLKNYEPATSHLEELITNHAVAAGRRLRLADLKPGAEKAPVQAAAVAEPEDYEDEDEATVDSLAEAPTASPKTSVEYPDSVNAAESSDFDDVDQDSTPAPAANALSADDAAELLGGDPDLGDLGNLDGLDGLDDFGDDANADLKGEGDLLADLADELDGELGDTPSKAIPEKKPSAMAAAAAGDDLEDLADLSDFDPDKTDGGDDDLSADLGDLLADDETTADLAIDEPLVAGAEADNAAALDATPDQDEASGIDLLAGDDDLFGEAEAEVGGEALSTPIVDDRELDDDLMALAVEENDPAAIDPVIEPEAEPAIETLAAGDLDFGADDLPLTDETENPLAGIAGLENGPEVGDPLAMDADPLDDTEEDPLGADAGESAGERVAATLNRALLSLTMAKDLADGLARVAPALHEAGLTRGLLLDASKAQAKPLLAWEPHDSSASVKRTGLEAFVTPGLAPALARQFAGWMAFDDATRNANLQPFSAWLDERHQLRVAAVPLSGDRQFVVLTAWNQATRDDAGVRAAALELIRKLATKALK